MNALLPWLVFSALAEPRPREPLAPTPPRLPALQSPASDHSLTVKFGDNSRARLVQGQLRFDGQPCPTAVAFVQHAGLVLAPLITLPGDRIAALEARAAQRSGVQSPDLQGMFKVQTDVAGPDLVDLAAQLQALPCAEYTHISASLPPPPADLAPTTPDYTGEQGYLGADPGIDADFAHAQGITGTRLRLSDCEYGWDVDHEDLVDLPVHVEPDQTVHPDVAVYGWDDHGTAVLGETSAVDNGYGITGAAPGAEVYAFTEWSVEAGGRRVDAIAAAIEGSAEGDVVLLEMQTGGCDDGLAPAETNPDVFTLVELARDAGIVVVAAAGNGSVDLDGGCYPDAYGVWGDSGAIIVGAGTADSAHSALSFSTHGERVSLQGWGTGVFTLGYGNILGLSDPSNQTYTTSFGGTSSASPIVASAAVLVQDFAIQLSGGPLDPLVLRELLISTGRAQGSGKPIGPLPDVQAAMRSLDGDLDGALSMTWGGDDCDDAEARAHPGATEVWYDGIDGDCLGGDDNDADGDGAASADHGGTDCDDSDPAVNPDAEEIDDNGVDDDCDGSVDGAPGVALGDSPSDGDGKGSGCSVAGGPALVWLTVPALLAARRRRRAQMG